MNVEKGRYGDELAVDIRCEVDAGSVELPPFSIQPLVENAIVHGVRQSEHTGYVNVVIEQGTDGTMITVADNGVGIQPGRVDRLLQERPRRGIGLRNVHSRLLMQYGRGLELTSAVGEGTTVTFVVPDTSSMA